MAALADGGFVKVTCGFCREQISRVLLHRVGHRLLCRRCLTALKRSAAGEVGPGLALQREETRSLRKISAYVTLGCLILKAGVFYMFFRWAQTSDVGAGALRGAVAADVFTWAVLSFLDWSARSVQVTVGGLFEFALLWFYFNRDAWFAINTDITVMAISMLFFFLVLFTKVGVWGMNHVLQVTGVTERAST